MYNKTLSFGEKRALRIQAEKNILNLFPLPTRWNKAVTISDTQRTQLINTETQRLEAEKLNQQLETEKTTLESQVLNWKDRAQSVEGLLKKQKEETKQEYSQVIDKLKAQHAKDYSAFISKSTKRLVVYRKAINASSFKL